MGTEQLYHIGRNKDGTVRLASLREIFENAEMQERDGVKPRYAWTDKGKIASPCGGRVWNSFDYGCGVVYRNKRGELRLLRGLPGDFCCCVL